MPAASPTTTPPTLEERFRDAKARIAEAARRSGRSPDEILLVAVTKTAEPEDIRRLMELGQADFAENRVQQLIQRASMAAEWMERLRVLPETTQGRRGPPIDDAPTPAEPAASTPQAAMPAGLTPRWHMIGVLQRNKVRKVLELCRIVHSVDNLRLAEDIQQALAKTDRRFDVLLQVNVSGEESKQGVAGPAAAALAEQIDSMYHVRLRGLMTMAPYSDDPEHARPHFARARELFEDIKKLGLGEGRFNILSMGMSGDYQVAIEEGANVVRLGSAIFGPPSADADEGDDD